MKITQLILLSCLAQAAAADDLGRLFFTPAERLRFDEARHAPPEVPLDAAASPVTPTPTPDPTPAQPPAAVTVNGIVRRAHGPSTAWINGVPGTRRDLSALEGQELRIARDAVEVLDPAGGARVKPGQTFDPAEGRVSESFDTPAAGALQ